MREPRRGPSIERRLPLLMTAVLVAVLATAVVATYRTFATQARAQSQARLATVTHLLVSSGASAAQARLAALGRATRDTTLVRLVAEARAHPGTLSPAVTARADSALRSLMTASDSGLPTSLWTADGVRVAGVGGTTDPVERGEWPAPDAFAIRPTDSVVVQPTFVAANRVYYHVVVPVTDRGTRVGYVVMLRRTPNSSTLANMLHEITGEDAELFVHQDQGTVWATIHGVPTTPPTSIGDGVVMRNGVARLSATSRLPGTPWRYTLEEPLAAVLARPRALLGQLAIFAFVLTIAGAAAAWVIGRRMARPLASLTEAAESIARGDYHSRVQDAGRDEVGRLAKSFNAMAAQVDASNRALSRQYDDARAVAEELERANRQLQGAMAAVEEARDAAEQANRAKSDFLATMSHELRTPLNAIGGYAELLQLGIYGAVTDEQSAAVGRIVRSQQHLLGLITDVLNFATLNATKVEFDVADVSVAEAVAAMETMTAPQLAAKGLRYECALSDPSLHVRADREKLQQILLNLMSNAVKFTPAHGSVRLQAVADGDVALIAVRDTGIGIDASRLSRVFEPFVQVDRALNRPHEGVGLGLAISRDLAAGMGGELRVESEPGVGSTFTLVLPRAASPLRATTTGVLDTGAALGGIRPGALGSER